MHEGRGEVLGGKSRVEVSQQHLIDVRCTDTRVLKSLARRFDDQAFHRFSIEFSERRMCPPDDRDVHGLTPSWLARSDALSISRSSRFKTLP